MFKEFQAFIMRGNVMDLAVGVIIGGAFGAIVNSLVADILMPVLGLLTGGINFSGLSFTFGGAVVAYGKFIQAVFSFLILAFAIFSMVKAINSLQKKKEEAPPAPAAPSAQEVLLGEIRDLLKNRP
ncbi:MAG: large-conductance mechanosensitive channel protein MscL [Microscillaceae bacterium]|jgi:large conductance mechanosensitive channel|nr:large-conductance mechanosensitive channel protein MscL [Microscillaceae bacterium]